MNRITIIGNLTRDPDTRTTANGDIVCSFTVAVNRRTSKDHPEADYFRVSAWRQLGELCQKYLAKGRKVCVIGSVRATAYNDRNGQAAAGLEVTATEVEFLTPKKDADAEGAHIPRGDADDSDMTPVDDDGDELPY